MKMYEDRITEAFIQQLLHLYGYFTRIMIKYDGNKCPSKDHNKLNNSHANIL